MKKLFFLLILVGLLACKKTETVKLIKLKGGVFGTTYNITYVADKNHQQSIDSLFYLVNKSLSTYIPTSDISKINKGDSTIVVDEMFKEVFKKSKRIYAETNGFFDPTVGNLVNVWGFGPKKEKKDLDSVQVDSLMKYVGLPKVSLEKGKIKKQFPEIYLDFNSIAKGYGIDVVGRFLESKKINNYLIEIGGEIRARGKKPNNKLWAVAVEDPNQDGTQSYEKVITLDNMSMATSGNYRKYRIGKNGQKYVHTVNPITGFAIESNLLSASVIAPADCADVDAYATAFMAMGLEKTLEFTKKYPQIKVILIYLNSEGEILNYSN
ncbi:FAD:protein FMN transferase [Tenacibaculum holothuriorum]|nr:FAD:protein FMN transferase [Tenacibaculum holothuriorum]